MYCERDKQGRIIAEILISAQNAVNPAEEVVTSAELLGKGYVFCSCIGHCFSSSVIADVEL